MRADFYLAVTKNGSGRLTKNKPTTKANEVLVKLQLEVPDKAFQKPVLEAKIAITDADIEPTEIKVTTNALGSWLKP